MARSKVCVMPLCPNASVVRIADVSNSRRLDMCENHAITAIHLYGNEVTILETYDGFDSKRLKEVRKWN